MKKISIVACAVLGTAGLLVMADYFALFGTTSTEQLDLITINFITIDEESRTPVTGVHARCFQSNNKNACSERQISGPGAVAVSIPVMTTVTKSYFFVQNISLRDTVDSKLRIMFVHPDYANPVETFMVSELQELAARPLTITMPKSQAEKY